MESPTQDGKVFKPVSELLGTEMVKIFVGEERKLFYLHQELICDRSEYFRAAFKGGFRESKDKTMNLEDDDPIAFGLLVDWLYCNASTYKLKCEECGETHDSSHRLNCELCGGARHESCKLSSESREIAYKQRNHVLKWAKLHILADKLNMVLLSEDAAKRYIRCLKYYAWFPSRAEVELIFNEAHESSKLRAAIPDLFIAAYMTTEPQLKDIQGWWDAVNVNSELSIALATEIYSHIHKPWRLCSVSFCSVHDEQGFKHGS